MVTVGDLVLVYQEEQPAFFARIEDISADPKPNWYQVKFLVLQVPVSESVWILRDVYINGDAFTMNGVRFRIEKVQGPYQLEDETLASESGFERKGANVEDKVISLFDRKKR